MSLFSEASNFLALVDQAMEMKAVVNTRDGMADIWCGNIDPGYDEYDIRSECDDDFRFDGEDDIRNDGEGGVVGEDKEGDDLGDALDEGAPRSARDKSLSTKPISMAPSPEVEVSWKRIEALALTKNVCHAKSVVTLENLKKGKHSKVRGTKHAEPEVEVSVPTFSLTITTTEKVRNTKFSRADVAVSLLASKPPTPIPPAPPHLSNAASGLGLSNFHALSSYPNDGSLDLPEGEEGKYSVAWETSVGASFKAHPSLRLSPKGQGYLR
ncbi:hypothetical protein Drorol1_Dr00020635 [Drosera rotundifolia]